MHVDSHTLTLGALEEIAAAEGITIYNYRCKERRDGRTRHSFVLRPLSDTRRAFDERGSGRRKWAVCWHGHWAYMDRLFAMDPAARLTSSLAKYDGRAEFHRLAWTTGGRNIGNAYSVERFEQSCRCEDGDAMEVHARELAGIPELVA